MYYPQNQSRFLETQALAPDQRHLLTLPLYQSASCACWRPAASVCLDFAKFRQEVTPGGWLAKAMRSRSIFGEYLKKHEPVLGSNLSV